jgi:hypothetical protein
VTGRAERVILALMAALLSPVVQASGIWRVRIAWPNGNVHHFGKLLPRKMPSGGSMPTLN